LTSGTDFGAVTIIASGGSADNGYPGAAGTIYLQTSSQSEGQGKLLVNNANQLPQVATTMMLPGTALNGFSQIVITNSGNIGIRTNIDFSQANFVGSGVGSAFATIRSPAIGLTFPTNITGNYTLNIDVPVTITGSLAVATDGRLSHTWNTSARTYWMSLTVASNLTVHGQINADGQGYAKNNGPSTTTPYNSLKSAGHGGCGGGYVAGAQGGTYGSITNPTTLGSGGPDQFWPDSGGGAVKLNVGGVLTVDAGAVISAQAVQPAGGYNGRGAGGSINITCASLAGSGSILANGGSLTGDGCGGGGGRIAIYLTASDDFSPFTIRAYGGLRGGTYTNGGAGTIYLKKASASFGTLIVNTPNAGPTAPTLISSNVTDAIAGDVVITNSAIFAMDTNLTLRVNGSWVNRVGTNSFLAGTNSTVLLAGTNAGTLYGNTTFWNLTATNAGKVLTFEAAKTNTVQGLIALAGVTLKSTVNGQYTYLTLATNGGSQQIGAVTVEDNNAGGGQLLLAGPKSVNNGRNVNWKFPASGTTFFFR